MRFLYCKDESAHLHRIRCVLRALLYYFFDGGELVRESHSIASVQSAALLFSISPQFSDDRRNKLPVRRSILSTCTRVDLPVSRPGLIDSWVKASGNMSDTTWLLFTHDCCMPDCRPNHIMTRDGKEGNTKILYSPSICSQSCGAFLHAWVCCSAPILLALRTAKEESFNVKSIRPYS